MADLGVVALSRHGTLVADEVEQAQLAQDAVEVKNRGTGSDEIYFTVNGATPTVQGNDTYILSAGESLVVPLPDPGRTVSTVKLVSSTTPKYSITGV